MDKAPIGQYTPQESAEGAMPRRATPELSGISVGPALERVGQTFDVIAHQNGAIAATQTMGDARAKFTQRLIDAQNNYKSGDDVVGTLGAEFKKYRDEALKQVTFNPAAKKYLSEQMASFGSELSQQAMRIQAEAQVNDRIERQKQGTQSAAVAVGLDPNQYAKAREEQLTGISQLQVEPKERARLATEATSTMAWSASLKLATDHPDQVLEALKQPDAGHPALNDLDAQQRQQLTRYAEAQSNDNRKQNEDLFAESVAHGVTDTYRTGGPAAGAKAYQAIDKLDATDEIKDKIYSKINQGVAQMHEEAVQAHGQAIAQLHERIANGTAGESERATAQYLFHHNALTPEQYGAALGGVDNAEKEKAKKLVDISTYADAYQKGTPLAPNDEKAVKGVDTLFQWMTGGVQPGSDQYVNAAIDIGARTGVTPKSAVSWATANLVSGKPEDAAKAAQLIERFSETNARGAPFAVGAPERAMASGIYEATKAGTDPVAAVEMARENAKLSKTQRQVLDQQWKDQTGSYFGKQTAAMDSSAIRAGLKDDPHYNPPGLFSGSVPQPPLAMSAEYAHLVQSYFYHTNGNVEAAKKLAIQDLKSTWGVSDVNGSRELVKYAPERMVPGLTSDMVRKDIADTVKDEKFPQPKDAPYDPKTVKLVEDPTATAASQGRVWNLTAPDKFGAADVLRDKSGMPLRYALPEPKQAIKVAKADQDAKDMQRVIRAQETASLARLVASQRIDEGMRE